MCCFQGVNDFEFESYTRKKHFVLQNSQKIHSPPPKPTNIPVIELYQTDYDPLNFTTNEPQFTGCSSARSDYFTSARNSVRPNTSATLRSNEIIPPLQFGQTNYEQDFDRAPCSSARSTRSTASKQHWERPLSCFPWLDDEMLRPSSARRVQTPVRIVNPTGKSKQIYRNLVSIFKKVQRI
ncbi:hypothetical protein TRFO_31259 [Tritrichomonas foetus]|uniref:Uncharacterized protein n=1 Tax=Tritrichomonas foetus TaxID=1144522 RepID=A0A1J4JRN5_9EUKA|nr:hypothetical protein TRFO_31259 [Tritrichomonas foetus]|eukprot:OHT01785.1 hypothetical protein TRFO_31259 [Tritrichomonas foetus]